MTEGFSQEAPRPAAPRVEAPRPAAISPEQLREMNQIVGEIAEARKNSPQVAKQIEQLQEASSTGEGQQGASSSHQALQELAKGVRVTKIDRFIYKAVQDAKAIGKDVESAMQQLQAGAKDGTLYNIAENHITNPNQLEKVCRAAGVTYQEVQAAAQKVIEDGQLGKIPDDQVLALEIIAFRDILKTNLSNQDTFQGAYDAISGRMNNEKTREKYKELTGEELTIENVIASPKIAESLGKGVDSRSTALNQEIEQECNSWEIANSDGKQILFEELGNYSPEELAQAVYDSIPTGVIQSQMDAIDAFRKRGRRLIMQATGANRDFLVEQQEQLIRLSQAHLDALDLHAQQTPLPAAA